VQIHQNLEIGYFIATALTHLYVLCVWDSKTLFILHLSSSCKYCSEVPGLRYFWRFKVSSKQMTEQRLIVVVINCSAICSLGVALRFRSPICLFVLCIISPFLGFRIYNVLQVWPSKPFLPLYLFTLFQGFVLFWFYLSIYLWLYSPLLGLRRFFSFLIFYTVGNTPWTEYQPVARPLPAHKTAQTE
jgi:hypothetical protein